MGDPQNPPDDASELDDLHTGIEKAEVEIESLRAKLKITEEALEFYVHENNDHRYLASCRTCTEGFPGKKAREALSAIRSEAKGEK